MRVHRTSSVFFSFRTKRREKILCVSIELILYFLLAGENSMRDLAGNTTLLNFTEFLNFLKG